MSVVFGMGFVLTAQCFYMFCNFFSVILAVKDKQASYSCFCFEYKVTYPVCLLCKKNL
jgi:hypothetical protein